VSLDTARVSPRELSLAVKGSRGALAYSPYQAQLDVPSLPSQLTNSETSTDSVGGSSAQLESGACVTVFVRVLQKAIDHVLEITFNVSGGWGRSLGSFCKEAAFMEPSSCVVKKAKFQCSILSIFQLSIGFQC
jgi:hypothetical protein